MNKILETIRPILIWKISAVMVFIMIYSPVYAAGDRIGSIKNIKGDVQIERNGKMLAGTPGLFLMENDIIVTGADAALGLIFQDNGILTMGPDSRLEIQDFAFMPARKELSFTANIIKGTLTYLSGVIARLKPDSVKFKTPSATVGIRGTHIAIKVSG